jgi:prolipoprotein diacylglyceryltransferase
VFPTPFYEVIMAIGIFFLLWGIRKKITTAGVLFCIYLIFNGTERFLIEKIRVNSTYKIGQLAITQAEIISSCMILIGFVGIIYLSRKKTVA